jgi:pimeloyl-ACP methyl ester carboxylesterase
MIWPTLSAVTGWIGLQIASDLASPNVSRPPLAQTAPYGRFPLQGDPFRFIPCTNNSIPPSLNDGHADDTWAALYDPNPAHWSWGAKKRGDGAEADAKEEHDEYSGRGIYLCGYLDVPLDYHNNSDKRIVRLAVAKYQVSGLARPDESPYQALDLRSSSSAGHKSERTIIVEPGGPGGSGTLKLWSSAEEVSARFSDGQFDVLGWDPRGVNMSLPGVSCFPHDAQRDRWTLVRQRCREATTTPLDQLHLVDAMNDASFAACRERLGDLGRFVSTAIVARDLDEIRKQLGEDEVTGYFISYGTGIAQTYANMFPQRVGRMILDGVEYVKDHRAAGGFGYTALDNVTHAWHDGFLGECLKAGPDSCALAKLLGKGRVDATDTALHELQDRVETLIRSLISRPLPAHTVKSGPSLITYSGIVQYIYQVLYRPQNWPVAAQMLYELTQGNTTLAAEEIDDKQWTYDPTKPPPPGKVSDFEDLGNLVICADSFDAPEQPFSWWSDLWADMTAQSWIAGDSRFQGVFPCRHFNRYWNMSASDVYRGDLNTSLANPVLLISEVYDPATPLRNARRLAREMGPKNARLVVHHGYGHSSQFDVSSCTEEAGRRYILEGKIPEEVESHCLPDGKPYLGK